MTRDEMESALRTGYNKQGRILSESMRLKYFAAMAPVVPKPRHDEQYRGMEIWGHAGHWGVREDGKVWPRSFTSTAAARAAIDRCWQIRDEMNPSAADPRGK